MYRRAAILALALLVAVPLNPAAAADPSASPSASPEATATPAATPAIDPTAAPSVDPSPTVDPTAAPSVDPSPTADPSVAPPATPVPSADPSPSATPGRKGGKANGGLDATNRWIVILRNGSDVAAVKDRAGRGLAIAADRTFTRSVRGFSATMSAAQAKALRADPEVTAVVPDEIVHVTSQYTPLGVRRIGGLRSTVAAIDGSDTRVDADVAIVDTGIDPAHPDLNVVGGYNCSTADRSLWRDVQNHGTHVAGTVGAKDNGSGVVGVAPGVRLWAVKILNDEGYGYLSWYVCGLDWIAAQRDPSDASRPLFEAVNMSVAKPGRDDKACGTTNADILHAAICRLVGSGVTVVAAAGNDASTASTLVPAAYDEVITVSALADTDGRAGGLGSNLCYSWGTYDRDDTIADFSNYGWDVDIMAPGKCIWSTLPGNRFGYSSGTSMAAPHVTGAVALYKASRPYATPAQVKEALLTLGTMNWDVSSDRDSYHEPLLDVSRIVPLGDYAIQPGTTVTVPESGGTVTVPVSVVRSEGFFEDVALSVQAPTGIAATLSATDLAGFTATDAFVTITVPRSRPAGTYSITISGRNWNRVRTGVAKVTVLADAPTAYPPLMLSVTGSTFATTSVAARAQWAPATDPSSPIAGYELQWSVDGGAWTAPVALGPTVRSATRTVVAGHSYAVRTRARDAAGNWSPWTAATPYRMTAIQDSSTAVKRAGTWYRYLYSSMSGGSTVYSKQAGASLTVSVTGRGFALVMPKGPTRGSARVYIDGALAGTISLYRSTSAARQVVLSRGYATTQTHTVKIVLVGTSGRPRVDLDAIVVLK